jgi:hypothetical protein
VKYLQEMKNVKDTRCHDEDAQRGRRLTRYPRIRNEKYQELVTGGDDLLDLIRSGIPTPRETKAGHLRKGLTVNS